MECDYITYVTSTLTQVQRQVDRGIRKFVEIKFMVIPTLPSSVGPTVMCMSDELTDLSFYSLWRYCFDVEKEYV